ncbi:hypothetical protein Tco_0163641 [Tanacetum coccineum]
MFPAIVYKDALTSELEFSSEPMVNPQHVNDVNWKIETSLSDSDDEKYYIIYNNDLFSYKIFPVNDLKLDMGNGDDKIDIKQSSGCLHTAEVTESVGFRAYWANSLREMASKAEERLRRLCHRLIAFSIVGRGQAPEKAPEAADPTPRTTRQRLQRLEDEVHRLRESLG